ncbi:methyltransferase domain-containing protein [Pseudochelatococcus sp. B33]
MTSAPRLFDRPLQRRRLTRALRGEAGYGDFLLARAVEDLVDRLAAVKRHFGLALDLGTPTPAAAAALAATGAVERLVRAAPVAGAEGGGDLAADEELLPLAEGKFDLAVSALALQNVNDLPGALVQVCRILKPDGLFLAALLGGETLTELRQSFAHAEAELEGGVSPRVAPFVDLRDLGGLLQRAGFALPVTDVDRVSVRYGDPVSLMRDLRAMGLANALSERSRRPLRRATLMRACEIYVERFAGTDGRLPATFDVLWLSGWAPHESQQKPLRPGSARAKLADVLPDRSRPPPPSRQD